MLHVAMSLNLRYLLPLLHDVCVSVTLCLLISTAVTQWCSPLRACVKPEGRHFEHKLSQ